jgi:hypothetical protein
VRSLFPPPVESIFGTPLLMHRRNPVEWQALRRSRSYRQSILWQGKIIRVKSQTPPNDLRRRYGSVYYRVKCAPSVGKMAETYLELASADVEVRGLRRGHRRTTI